MDDKDFLNQGNGNGPKKSRKLKSLSSYDKFSQDALKAKAKNRIKLEVANELIKQDPVLFEKLARERYLNQKLSLDLSVFEDDLLTEKESRFRSREVFSNFEKDRLIKLVPDIRYSVLAFLENNYNEGLLTGDYSRFNSARYFLLNPEVGMSTEEILGLFSLRMTDQLSAILNDICTENLDFFSILKKIRIHLNERSAELPVFQNVEVPLKTNNTLFRDPAQNVYYDGEYDPLVDLCFKGAQDEVKEIPFDPGLEKTELMENVPVLSELNEKELDFILNSPKVTRDAMAYFLEVAHQIKFESINASALINAKSHLFGNYIPTPLIDAFFSLQLTEGLYEAWITLFSTSDPYKAISIITIEILKDRVKNPTMWL